MHRILSTAQSFLILGAAVVASGASAVQAADYGLPAGTSTVRVASGIAAPPYVFYAPDGTTVMGYEPDLLAEAAKRLGITLEWNNVEYTQMFAGVGTGRFDLGAYGVIDRKEREESLDILSYIKGYATVAGKAGVENITDFKAFCGTSMVIVQGQSYEDYWRKYSTENCDPDGKPIKSLIVKDDPAAVLALKTDRVQYFPSAAFSLAYLAQQSDGSIKVANGIKYFENRIGFIFPKGSKLAPAFRAVIQEMMDDGTYLTILKKWSLEGGAIKDAKINILTNP